MVGVKIMMLDMLNMGRYEAKRNFSEKILLAHSEEDCVSCASRTRLKMSVKLIQIAMV